MLCMCDVYGWGVVGAYVFLTFVSSDTSFICNRSTCIDFHVQSVSKVSG